MDTVAERCCGQEVRTFATTTTSLLLLRDWLMENRVSLVGMESTGVYWKCVSLKVDTEGGTDWICEGEQSCRALYPRSDLSHPLNRYSLRGSR